MVSPRLLLRAGFFLSCVHAQIPINVKGHGPRGFDGGWKSFSIGFSSNGAHLALYPGLESSSYAPDQSTWCPSTGANLSLCNPALGPDTLSNHTFYNPTQSAISAPTIQNAASSSGNFSDWRFPQPMSGQANGYLDNATLFEVGSGSSPARNITIGAMNNSSYLLPNGSSIPAPVGIIGLGPNTDTNNTILASLFFSKTIPSMSFGLHMGSDYPEIDPSLVLGGYDTERMIGEPLVSSIQTIQSSPKAQLTLVDISFWVVQGPNPFEPGTSTANRSFTTDAQPAGLLAANNASISQGEQVFVNPGTPYIYLPQSTCDAITSYLPVDYNSDVGLYTWNMSSSSSSNKTIASAAALKFTFIQPNGENYTISLPSSMLNKTLGPPIVAQDMPYLPIQPVPAGKDYALGRAFLQAAVFGVNWQSGDGLGNFFLGQAAGPRVSAAPQLEAIQPGQKGNFSGQSDVTWENTWQDYWDTSSTSSNTTSTDSGGLSDNAKIGIGVGVAVGVSLVVGVVGFFVWRRRKYARLSSLPSTTSEKAGSFVHSDSSSSPVVEMDGIARRGCVERPAEVDRENEVAGPSELPVEGREIPLEIAGDNGVPQGSHDGRESSVSR